MSREPMDTSSRAEFVEYYARQSATDETRSHFERIHDAIVRGWPGLADRALAVVDVGGGAGTMSQVWARHGHRVTCVDINEDLIGIGRQRAAEAGLDIRFEVASATGLPVSAAEADVCLAPELLEHVEDWESCLDEFARVLKPGGVLYLTTTNVLCPIQNEFNLPLYSWYPAAAKRWFEERARTDRPDLANYATYPAVHWFSFYGLRRALRARGFERFLDGFDLARARDPQGVRGLVLGSIATIGALRLIAQLFRPSTTLLAVRGRG